MEKWVLGYGHGSVAEGAVIGLSIEGASILASKVIEDNRLSSFIEKSTRYVSFDSDSFYHDKDLEESEYKEEIRDLIKELFDTYMQMHEPVLEYIKKIAPLKEGMSESAWTRASAARRFDAIRYILPTATKTSIGWTVNARQLAHAIQKLLSHPLREMQELGASIKEEATKVLPSLLKYADKNEYFPKTRIEMKNKTASIEIEDKENKAVELVEEPKNPENMIVTSILYKYKKESYKKAKEQVESMNYKEKESLFDEFLKHMGKFDYPLRELEHQYFTFDIVMDYGAFRDLQRHRMTTQTDQILSSNLGYDIPEDIINAGQEEKYVAIMEKAKILHEKIKDKYPLQAQYILPMAYKKRFLITMNLREIYHYVKVRTTEMAHPSYKNIAYKIYKIMKEKHPLLVKYLHCEYEKTLLGRLNSEEKTERKTKLI